MTPTTSIVVLDARTGTLKWWHQTAPEDWQDLDLVAPPVLYRDSKIRDVLGFKANQPWRRNVGQS